jgi:hypothetical protein
VRKKQVRKGGCVTMNSLDHETYSEKFPINWVQVHRLKFENSRIVHSEISNSITQNFKEKIVCNEKYEAIPHLGNGCVVTNYGNQYSSTPPIALSSIKLSGESHDIVYWLFIEDDVEEIGSNYEFTFGDLKIRFIVNTPDTLYLVYYSNESKYCEFS